MGIAVFLVLAFTGWQVWGQAPAAGEVRVNRVDGLKYAFVPGGKFQMGCAGKRCADEETPAHAVEITKGFWMGQSEVTVEAFRKYAKAAKKKLPFEADFRGKNLNPGWAEAALPITMVDWNEARGYCEWAGMRLPTEAEWEFAARGGKAEERYGELDAVAWNWKNSGGALHPGGGKTANGYQLFDMLGNAVEWTSDWYRRGYRGAELQRDPQGAARSEFRAQRGGSAALGEAGVRAGSRTGMPPSFRDPHVGFRCAGRTLKP